MKQHTLKRIIALLCACALTFLSVIGSPVTAKAEHREYPYDVDTEWTPDDVEEMLDYAKQWVGKIDYASSQNNTDPGNRRHEELHSGGATDCSWFVFHVLYRFGLLNDFVHSYDWGNSPSCYPGAHNINNSISSAVPGDIICTGAGTKPQNSHVAIYIGNGQVVECCAGRGVVISDAPGHPRDIVHFNCIPTEYIDKGVDVE